MGFCAGGLGWGGWGGWGGPGWLGPMFGLVLLVGVIGLLVVGALWLARSAGHWRATAPATRSEPLAIARRRLAAGKITTSEFEELQDRLDR